MQRKIRWLIVTLIVALATQPAHGQLGWGAEAQLGLATMRFLPPQFPIRYTSSSVSPVLHGRVGLLVDFPLDKHTYFQVGVGFSRKGAARTFSYHLSDSFNERVSQTLILHYADLPLTVVYKSGTPGHTRIVAGLGAVPSLMVGGRSRLHDDLVYEGVAYYTYDNTAVRPGNEFQGFDIGLQVTAGVELENGWYARAFFLTGTTDFSRTTEIDKNRTAGVSVAYLLGKGRTKNKEEEELIDNSVQAP